MMRGMELIADVNAFSTVAGQAGLWWLGQHSFILKAAGQVIYIDAFLSPMNGRRVGPLLACNEVSHANFICGTHDHADHIDRGSWPAMAVAAPKALFVVPEILRKKLSKELKIAEHRFLGIDAGQSLELIPGVKLTAIAAAHESLDPDPISGQFAFLGFIVEAGGVTVCHAGDTCWYEGLQTSLRRWNFDAMLVPINGRDAERYAANIIGNMTYQEAADLCGPLGPKLVVPAHWDMFAANLGDPAAFCRYMKVKYPRVPTIIPEYGARITLGGA